MQESTRTEKLQGKQLIEEQAAGGGRKDLWDIWQGGNWEQGKPLECKHIENFKKKCK